VPFFGTVVSVFGTLTSLAHTPIRNIGTDWPCDESLLNYIVRPARPLARCLILASLLNSDSFSDAELL
jgi:hypothetical protein